MQSVDDNYGNDQSSNDNVIITTLIISIVIVDTLHGDKLEVKKHNNYFCYRWKNYRNRDFEREGRTEFLSETFQDDFKLYRISS